MVSTQPAPNGAGSQHAPTAFSLQDAATLLGVSLNTLRRRIAAGEVRAERVTRPQGHVWRVYLNVQSPPAQQAEQQPASRLQQHPDSTLQEPAASVQPSMEIQRAEAMAGFLTPLLQRAIEPLVAELGETRRQLVDQGETIGRLRAELEHALTTIQALQAPVAPNEPESSQETPTTPAAASTPSRPWWRAWW